MKILVRHTKNFSGSYENDGIKKSITGEWNGWNKNGNNTYKGKYNKGKKIVFGIIGLKMVNGCLSDRVVNIKKGK